MKQLLVMAFAIFFIACTDAGENSANSEKDSSGIASSGVNDQESKEERNKETAMKSVNAFMAGKVDEVMADADKDMMEYGDGSFPPMKGLDSMKIGMQSWMNAFSDYKGSDLQAVADGDHVIVYGVWTGTWTKEYMGMKPTNKSFKIFDADIFKFNDAGKMIEHRGVQSSKTLADQIGMKMP